MFCRAPSRARTRFWRSQAELVLALALWIRGVRRRGAWLGLPGGRLILRRALGLKRLGHKTTIGRDFAFYQALCAVLKCVGKRVSSHIADRKTFTLLHQNELDAT